MVRKYVVAYAVAILLRFSVKSKHSIGEEQDAHGREAGCIANFGGKMK